MKILEERGKRYGKFEDHAVISQGLKNILFSACDKNGMDDDMIESLEMICHKLARIANGDPYYADSWVDIAGYAQLIAIRLEKQVSL
jgi:hypothetical protein